MILVTGGLPMTGAHTAQALLTEPTYDRNEQEMQP